MKIRLWNRSEFSKKINSTKQPSAGTGTEFEGFLRNSDPVSIYAPTIVLQFRQGAGGSEASTLPVLYTYAYIPDFGRYYFITDVVHDSGQWVLSLVVDVLASFKSQIGAESIYILRSSAESDGTIIDTKYPGKTTPTVYVDRYTSCRHHVYAQQEEETISNMFYSSYASGYYYIGVFSPDYNGVTYYAMTSANFRTFARRLFAFDPSESGLDFGEIADGITKNICNPSQWIASVMWMPFRPLRSEQQVDTINLGYYPITGITATVCWLGRDGQQILSFENLALRDHPQSASRGRYLNYSPYTTYTFYFYPFGVFQLDTSLLHDVTAVDIDVFPDIRTGRAVLYVKSHGGDRVLYTTEGQLGVPINLTQATVDYIGAAGAAIKGAFGTVTGFAQAYAGDIAGGISNMAASAVGGFLGFEKSIQPTASTLRGSGDMLTYSMDRGIIVETTFVNIVDEYNAEIGRPLCKVKTPAELGGYILANNAKIELAGTKSEMEEVETYLNTGFYYE